MRGRLFVAVVLLAAAMWPAWGFGLTFGPQIEERFASEYGSEYYYPHAERCRVEIVKNRQGRRIKVGRCR